MHNTHTNRAQLLIYGYGAYTYEPTVTGANRCCHHHRVACITLHALHYMHYIATLHFIPPPTPAAAINARVRVRDWLTGLFKLLLFLLLLHMQHSCLFSISHSTRRCDRGCGCGCGLGLGCGCGYG
jgi:hypothetical protein